MLALMSRFCELEDVIMEKTGLAVLDSQSLFQSAAAEMLPAIASQLRSSLEQRAQVPKVTRMSFKFAVRCALLDKSAFSSSLEA